VGSPPLALRESTEEALPLGEGSSLGSDILVEVGSEVESLGANA
jgi:hypothetical protein